MQAVLCHASLLNHLHSTGAVEALVKSAMEDTEHPLLMADDQKTAELKGMLKQLSNVDVKRRSDLGATTLCKSDLLVGLPLTAPHMVCCFTYCSHSQSSVVPLIRAVYQRIAHCLPMRCYAA